MLRVAFVGNEFFFTHALCRWLAERTDLRLIIWTSKTAWPHRSGFAWARVARRILRNARRKGVWRTLNEAAFYLFYVLFLQRKEVARICRLAESFEAKPRRPIVEITQIYPARIDDPELLSHLERLHLDAIFAMCTDVYFPSEFIGAPRLGAFLWHEGITPEYCGLYSAFWALLREDYARIGYTLLKMNRQVDGGPIYLQGPVEGVDFERDWHSYLGHKSILDSLPHVERFLRDLEMNQHQPIERPDAIKGYYSYPTATALAEIALRRLMRKKPTAQKEELGT